MFFKSKYLKKLIKNILKTLNIYLNVFELDYSELGYKSDNVIVNFFVLLYFYLDFKVKKFTMTQFGYSEPNIYTFSNLVWINLNM